MRQLIIPVLLGVFAAAPAWACNGEKCDAACELPHKSETSQAPQIPGGKTVLFSLEGVKCGKCAAKIEAKLKALHGVKHVAIDVEKQTLSVVILPQQVAVPALIQAVEQAGYKAKQS